MNRTCRSIEESRILCSFRPQSPRKRPFEGIRRLCSYKIKLDLTEKETFLKNSRGTIN